jgi:hypothetical protein
MTCFVFVARSGARLRSPAHTTSQSNRFLRVGLRLTPYRYPAALPRRQARTVHEIRHGIRSMSWSTNGESGQRSGVHFNCGSGVSPTARIEQELRGFCLLGRTGVRRAGKTGAVSQPRCCSPRCLLKQALVKQGLRATGSGISERGCSRCPSLVRNSCALQRCVFVTRPVAFALQF